MGRCIIDEQAAVDRVAHIAIHYLVVLDESLVWGSLVPASLLSHCLWDAYIDLIEEHPQAKSTADFIIEVVREYREGKRSVETAINFIQAAKSVAEGGSV